MALYEAIKANTIISLPKIAAAAQTSGILPPLPPLVVGRERVLQNLKQRVGIGSEPGKQRSTTTWKLPFVVSGGLAASLAVQVTIVLPIGKVLPEAGEQLTVGVADASSGSLAVTV